MFCFAKSISLATRVALAVSLNSVGHFVFYTTLFAHLGIDSQYHTDRVFNLLDKQTTYWSEHSKKATVKRARASRKQELWREELRKKVVDTRQGLCYSQGCALEGDNNEPGPAKKRKRNMGPKKPCQCGETSHQRTTSRLCVFNPKNVTSQETLEKETPKECAGQTIMGK